MKLSTTNELQFSLLLQTTHQVLSKNPKIITELVSRLHIPFADEPENESNVCFIDSKEVRPEFRQCFTVTDVSAYLWGFFSYNSPNFKTEIDLNLSNFPYPKNADDFWRLVQRCNLQKN